MRTVAGLQADLDRIDATLRELDPTGPDTPKGALVTREGLMRARQQLLDQLQDLRRPRLDLVLDGAPVTSSEIRVDSLTKVLGSLQESISSIAQSLTGRATARAAIPGPLREATGLRLVGTFAGSFGATLRGPATEEAQQVIVEADDAGSLLISAVDVVLNVIQLAARPEASDEPIVEAILPLGSRSFKHLKDLSSAIVDEEITASLVWRTATMPQRVVGLSRQEARRLEDVLGRTKLSEREQQITGRLGTVSDIRNAVELETNDGVIRAKVVDELVPELGKFYTRRVIGTFLVTVARSLVTGNESYSYLLLGLSLAEPEGGSSATAGSSG